MQDWVSVVSKDKSLEYVTLWYREFKIDSKDIGNFLWCKLFSTNVR